MIAGIDWHFIGHLQRNKVADVLRYCSWIESIDSMRLLEKVQQVAVQYNKTVQFYCSSMRVVSSKNMVL